MKGLISEEDLLRFVEHNPFGEYEFHVTIPKTVTYQYLGEEGSLYKYGIEHSLNLGIFGITIKMIISNEPNRNLIGIKSSFNYTDASEVNFFKRVESDTYIKKLEIYQDSALKSVEYRVLLLLCLSTSLLMPQSRVNVLNDLDITDKVIPELHYDEIIELLNYKKESHIYLAGRFREDISQVFQWMWFHYPQDITGFDERLKGISLEELSIIK